MNVWGIDSVFVKGRRGIIDKRILKKLVWEGSHILRGK